MDVPPGHRVRYAAPEPPEEDLASRLLSVCALADSARELERAQLRREHPQASEDRVEEMLVTWLQTRPGAEHGDGVGRPAGWPRD